LIIQVQGGSYGFISLKSGTSTFLSFLYASFGDLLSLLGDLGLAPILSSWKFILKVGLTLLLFL